MEGYLNNEMIEALQACDFTQQDNEAIRQILMRERSQRNSFSADESGTVAQYDRIIDVAANDGAFAARVIEDLPLNGLPLDGLISDDPKGEY